MQDAIAVQSLKSDIALLRQNIWPPANLANVEGLPIYYGTKSEVDEYYKQWTGLIERAQDLFQPFMEDEVLDEIVCTVDNIVKVWVVTLPASFIGIFCFKFLLSHFYGNITKHLFDKTI